MAEVLADDFEGILDTLRQRPDLQTRILALLAQDTPGKSLEGGDDRLGRFRAILEQLVEGQLTIEETCREILHQLPRSSSPHRGDNRVFADSWAERLVRTQLSRFYNQAVLEHLREAGETVCYIPHSSNEDPSSACSTQMAGKEHLVSLLHLRLVESYTNGNFSQDLKVPHHPHCTHVVKPKPAKPL